MNTTCYSCSYSPDQYNRTKQGLLKQLKSYTEISDFSAASEFVVNLHLFFTVQVLMWLIVVCMSWPELVRTEQGVPRVDPCRVSREISQKEKKRNKQMNIPIFASNSNIYIIYYIIQHTSVFRPVWLPNTLQRTLSQVQKCWYQSNGMKRNPTTQCALRANSLI